MTPCRYTLQDLGQRISDSKLQQIGCLEGLLICFHRSSCLGKAIYRRSLDDARMLTVS